MSIKLNMEPSNKPNPIKSSQQPSTRPVASLDTAYKMVGPVVLGLFIGYYIDQQFKTEPWWMLGMTFFGLITGFWSIIKPLYFSQPDSGEVSDKKTDSD